MGMILIDLDPKNFEYLDLIEPTDRLAFQILIWLEASFHGDLMWAEKESQRNLFSLANDEPPLNGVHKAPGGPRGLFG